MNNQASIRNTQNAIMARRKGPAPFLKIRTAVVLRLLEAKAYFADKKGVSASAGKKNVLIFGQGRTGSTLLEHLMVSTGHFSGRHEVLNTVTREVIHPTSFVRGLGRMNPGENIVVHVKPEHLAEDRRKRGPVDARIFLETLLEDGWFLVHIKRRDVLRQMISNYVAMARGAYHKFDAAEEDICVKVSVADFVEKYESQMKLLPQECDLLSGLPHLALTYEDHLEAPEKHQETIDSVLRYCELETRPVSTKLKKISTGSPSRFLSNREELQAAFSAKGWEWTL